MKTMMINVQIRCSFLFDHNEFSNVSIDNRDNSSKKQVHEIYQNLETMLLNQISLMRHYSIHLEKNNSIYTSFFLSRLLTRNDIDNTIRNTQFFIKFFGIFNHLFKHFPWFIVMWGCNTKLFNLKIVRENLDSRLKIW